MQINHYIKSANLIVSSEFITFIELHQELKLSNEQFLTIKQKFVNNTNGILTTSQLKFLAQHSILTDAEVNIISQHVRFSRYSSPSITLVKALVLGIMVGVIIIGLGYLMPELTNFFELKTHKI